MTEQSAPDTGTPASPDMGPSSTPPDTGGTATDTAAETELKAEAAKWQALARKHEQQAKENVAAAKELARVRREAMSDQDRAVSEATDRARSEAVAEVTARLGGRLVVAEIRSAVGNRLTPAALDAVLEHLDLTGFISPEGEVDGAAVTAFATRIAPEAVESTQLFPDLGQGARPPAATNGGSDPLLRDLKGKLGITM